MKAKVLCMCLAMAMLIQMSAMAESEHKHVWMDDIEHSDETTNRYYCECGAEKDEVIAEIRNYVITFDACGGLVQESKAETRENRLRSLPIPVRNSNYQWDGWYTEPDGGEQVTREWVYEEDTTLYAHWTVTGTYTLTFASDGGSYIRPVTGMYGSTINLKDYVPKKEGYIFKGWYTDPRTKKNEATSFTFNENGVVYARWEAVEAAEQPNELTSSNSTKCLTDEEKVAQIQKIIKQLTELMKQYMK